MKIIQRLIDIQLPRKQSAFLWGPRKTGKSYWIQHHLKPDVLIDLLKTDVFAEYASRPALLRERYGATGLFIVIDEIQKVPSLLDEVHWMIENKGVSFLLTGSSARKLRRGHANMLGGRAWRYQMMPLSVREISEFNLEKALVSGFLPPHLVSTDPIKDLRAYVADYLKEEIAAEGLVKNIPSFSEFLRVAAISSGELISYLNIARESGVSHRTVRAYFDILEDTNLGYRLAPWKASKKRRMILTEKFYMFDVGVTNHMAKRTPVKGGVEFGKAFEQFIFMELKAYQAYRMPDLPISFWRTSTGIEVDFILGDKELALEVKASEKIHEKDVRGLRALREEGSVKTAVLVCLERQERVLEGGIQVLPWEEFLDRLWSGQLIH